MYDLSELLKEMRSRDMATPELAPRIQIPNGTERMADYFKFFIEKRGEKFLYRQEYAEVGEWLTDNKSRGLFLYGRCGNGKSMLARFVIPALILNYQHLIINVYDAILLNKKPDEVLSKHLICLDDVGTEATETVIYGQRRQPLSELLDATEKQGKLLIFTSNLNGEELQAKYGVRTIDRLRAVTKRVLFQGESFRGKEINSAK
jgi:DNA replication protein DnaC